MDITRLIESHIDDSTLAAFASKLGLEKNQTTELVGAITPILTAALAKNAATPAGAEALNAALEKDHDGSIFTQLPDLLSDTSAFKADGILKHILGDKQSVITTAAAKALGKDPATVTKAMQTMAPLLMGALGKVKKQDGISIDALKDMLSTKNAGAQSSVLQSLITSFFDKDKDGSVADDLADMGIKMVKGFFKK